ncbi:phage tail protein I [Salmonella enterica]|nr:phage tail protein I [Salmonella enterica subsp. enterica]EAW9008957.1 phage tail protein I [Salmonella enterica]EAY5639840.1 phage tail protein I [Salmonella enterica]EBP3787358.1 phage tail protein I [Salmonella enterica subsp. enterica]EBP3796849.1 phage tail protein I [Salmonella enterica subsp. enterica]
MSNSLLPPSASGFMRSTEQASTRLDAIPVDLRKLWNPDECPVALLPYLAWAMSVDRWDKNWPEQVKRDVIKASWAVHRKKGTRAAIRDAIEPLGYNTQIVEWWENGGEPGTFTLEVSVIDHGVTPEMQLEIERLVQGAKPVSRHIADLRISQEILVQFFMAALLLDGDTSTLPVVTEPGVDDLPPPHIRPDTEENRINVRSVYGETLTEKGQSVPVKAINGTAINAGNVLSVPVKAINGTTINAGNVLSVPVKAINGTTINAGNVLSVPVKAVNGSIINGANVLSVPAKSVYGYLLVTEV